MRACAALQAGRAASVSGEGRGLACDLQRSKQGRVLERYDCYVIEVCDKRGQLLGSVRYTARVNPASGAAGLVVVMLSA